MLLSLLLTAGLCSPASVPTPSPTNDMPKLAAVLGAARDFSPVVRGMDGGAPAGVRVERAWEGEACRARLVHGGDEPVRVKEVLLFAWEHGLSDDTGLYGESLQMLSQTGGTLGAPQDLGYLTDRGHYKVAVPEGAKAAMYGMVMVRGAENRRLLLGFTSCRRFVGRFDLRDGRIDVVVETDGLTMQPGETWELEELVFAAGDHRDDMLAEFGARIGRNHPPLLTKSPPRGWCSWYCFGPSVTTEDVRRNLQWIAEGETGLRYVQIDDGYQVAMGDWLATGDAFGGGVQNVLREIREAGFEPAIWVAPFIAEAGSRVFREHPDWFIQGPDGTPLASNTVSFGGWRRGPWYCLDGTNPAVQDHLRGLFTTMREEWGCTYFKLDANFWGMMHGGTFHDPNATRVEAYRRGMAAVLEGTEDAFVLGCNHPIWPSFGMIHGSRSSMDVNREWEAMRRTGRENLYRNWQNGVLWWNDPDCLLVEAQLPENELLFHASLLHATGGMLLSGDDLPGMSAAAVARLNKVAQPTGVPCRFTDESLEVGIMPLEGETRVFLFNETGEPRERTFTLPFPHRVVDFWTEEYLDTYTGDVRMSVPPHAARVLRCTPIQAEDSDPPAPWPGAEAEWHGFRRHDFELDGRACMVVEPHEAAANRPWIWRARFFGHEPQTDLALLERGFHLAYIDVGGMFGSEAACDHWDAFYDYAVNEHGLAPRVAIEAMSRGGLIAMNWAVRRPERVACLYLDAPVLDVRSWPGGAGASTRREAEWEQCLAAHGLDAAQGEDFELFPPERIHRVAASVPILAVCGLADDVVPYAENTAVLAERYRAAGGSIFIVEKEGVGHHPHSLQDPRLIVDFVLRHTVGSADSFVMRGGLRQAFTRFAAEKQGRVAFLGGSITYNPGWRDMVCEDLRRRFPDAEFDFVAAGIPSMGSTPGAFRLERDVLSKGRIDFLFVEAAVNDSTNLRTAADQRRGMEGIVRHALAASPQCNVVLMHFVDPAKMESFARGEVPSVIVQHETVAEHYQLPSIDLAFEVTARIQNGEFTWKDDFKNLHPSPFGQKLYYDAIRRLLDAAGRAPFTHQDPWYPAALDDFCYDKGSVVDLAAAELGPGWTRVESWRPSDGKGTRPGFVDVPMLVAEAAGATLRLPFTGRGAGVWVAAGPDAGWLEYRVDEGRWDHVDLLTPWSRGLHLPWLHVLAAELDGGEHVLEVRVPPEPPASLRGTAIRIAAFVVNGPAR